LFKLSYIESSIGNNGAFFFYQNQTKMKNPIYVFLLLFLSSCFFNCKHKATSKTVAKSESSKETTIQIPPTPEIKPQPSEPKEDNKIPASMSTSTNSNFEFTNESYGCESFTVYKFNKDKTMALWINGENENSSGF